MLLPTLLSAGALALTANAFLLPLEIVEKIPHLEVPGGDVPDEVAQSHQGFEVTHSEFQTVRLDCSTCPFALESDRKGRHEWAANVKNELELKFSSENGKVSLNGKPFYPVSNPPLPPILSAKQIQKESDAAAKKWEGYHGDLTLSYSLEIESKKHFNKDKANLLSIVFTIMGLDGEMVNVDDIKILVIETDHEVHVASPQPPKVRLTVSRDSFILSPLFLPPLTGQTPNVPLSSAAFSTSSERPCIRLNRPRMPPPKRSKHAA